MRYMVLTSDGAIHETDSAEEYVALLDEYGAEVVDQAEPIDAEQQRLTNRALLAQYAKPKPQRDEARPCEPHAIRNCVRCYGL